MKKIVIGVNLLLENNPESSNRFNRDNYTIQPGYVKAVQSANALPLLIPPLRSKKDLNSYLNKVDAMLFTGGPDYPAAWYNEKKHPKTQASRRCAGSDLHLMQECLKRRIPILGVCAGHQLLNIALGGKLIQHMSNSSEHVKGAIHKAKIIKEGIFSEICGLKKSNELNLNSYHHQCINPEYLGKGLEVTALAFDNSIETIEGTDKNHFILGIQFHIERQENLCKAFLSRLAVAGRCKS